MADALSDYDIIRFLLSGEKSDLLDIQEDPERRRSQTQEAIEAQRQTGHERYITIKFSFHKTKKNLTIKLLRNGRNGDLMRSIFVHFSNGAPRRLNSFETLWSSTGGRHIIESTLNKSKVFYAPDIFKGAVFE